jgi:hypothetical protein
MVCAEDVITIYKRLMADGIQVWCGRVGDRCIAESKPALKSLDVIMLLNDGANMTPGY